MGNAAKAAASKPNVQPGSKGAEVSGKTCNMAEADAAAEADTTTEAGTALVQPGAKRCRFCEWYLSSEETNIVGSPTETEIIAARPQIVVNLGDRDEEYWPSDNWFCMVALSLLQCCSTLFPSSLP